MNKQFIIPILMACIVFCNYEFAFASIENSLTVYYYDYDGDGYGTPYQAVNTPFQPVGYVTNGDDCNDNDNSIHPGGIEVCNGADDDCDGSVDEEAQITLHPDIDGDGIPSASSWTFPDCNWRPGWSFDLPPGNYDCDDSNPNVYGGCGIMEVCNGIDDDGNGLIDGDDPGLTGLMKWYADADNDGYGNPNIFTLSCTQPAGYIHWPNNPDCDDSNAAVNPTAVEICNGIDDNCDGSIDIEICGNGIDEDCDGLIDESGNLYSTDMDGDGWLGVITINACDPPYGWFLGVGDDCDDTDPYVAGCFGTMEVCNGIDDDGDGLVDDNDPDIIGRMQWFADDDSDGHGDPNTFLFSCTQPSGYLPFPNSMDCDDSNAAVNPGVPEICNGIDDNCDGSIDIEICGNGIDEDCDGMIDESGNLYSTNMDGDGWLGVITINACDPPYGWFLGVGDDCDDTDPYVAGCFGTVEVCNGIDDDGDGLVDDNDPDIIGRMQWFADADGDGYGDANTSVFSCTQPSNYVPWPNNIDCDDADPQIVPIPWYEDWDGDGYAVTYTWPSPILSCVPIPGYSADTTDCNPWSSSIYPAAPEICDGNDNDCDGLIDRDDDPSLGYIFYEDADQDGYGNFANFYFDCIQWVGFAGTGTDCNDANNSVYPDAPEIADGLDNDCDGITDEGFAVLSVEAGDCEIVYYGYAPEACQILTVEADNGTPPYSFSWSNGATSSSINVCPDETTIYSVTVTDSDGQTAEDNVTVQVIDVTCGNNNNKVLVCHIPPNNPENAHAICISPTDIPDHLAHGCFVGICDAPDPCEGANQSMLITDSHIEETIDNDPEETVNINRDPEISFVLKPNPADDFIELETNFSEGIISIIDVSGKVVLRQVISDNKTIITTGELIEGIYFIRVQNGADCYIRNIVVMH